MKDCEATGFAAGCCDEQREILEGFRGSGVQGFRV